jgi:hypothetical protein
MKSEAKLQILKAGGHTYGTWKGKPIKPTQSEAHQTIENNEEAPMLPILLDDPKTDPKKPSADDNGPEILMPTSI